MDQILIVEPELDGTQSDLTPFVCEFFFITELTLVDMVALGICRATNDKHEVVNSRNLVVISVYLMKFYPFVGVLVILTQT